MECNPIPAGGGMVGQRRVSSSNLHRGPNTLAVKHRFAEDCGNVLGELLSGCYPFDSYAISE